MIDKRKPAKVKGKDVSVYGRSKYKNYSCTKCSFVYHLLTNHWLDIRYHCPMCQTFLPFRCLEPVPKEKELAYVLDKLKGIPYESN